MKGRQSCEDEHAGGDPTTVTTQGYVKQVHDLVLYDRRVTIGQTIEDIELSYKYVFLNVFLIILFLIHLKIVFKYSSI